MRRYVNLSLAWRQGWISAPNRGKRLCEPEAGRLKQHRKTPRRHRNSNRGQSVGFFTYNEGRVFAYFFGLKEPRFVPAYGGAELDPALMRGD